MHGGSIPPATSMLLVAVAVTACVPEMAAFRSIPVQVADGRPRDHAVVRVPLDALAAKLGPLQPQHLAFFEHGREPLPYRLVDDDHDGAPDAALVALSIAADGSTRLIAICPGPEAAGAPPQGPADPGVVLRFDRSED